VRRTLLTRLPQLNVRCFSVSTTIRTKRLRSCGKKTPALISEAGLTNVRVAQFAWALLEPSEGKFDFDWLDRSVAVLHQHGIAVILGTPSAALPPWLSEKYPEILMVNDQGMTVRPGGRRFTCPTNKTYRKLSLNIATEMAKAFANTAGLIGWQVDNEFTLQTFARCYCSYCRAGFQDWARQKYGTLDNLNQKWGTVFWSRTYTDWAQIPLPMPSNGEPNPALVLDYDRYQSYANASFAGEQVAMLRKLNPQHFITTNNVGAPLDTLDLRELYRDMDFASRPDFDAPSGVEVTRRRSAAREWVFVLNHSNLVQRVPLPRRFDSVVGGRISDGALYLKGYEVSVLQLST
jgi:beta-galactosidase